MKQKTNWKIQVWADSLESGKSQKRFSKEKKLYLHDFHFMQFVLFRLWFVARLVFFRKVGISFWNGMTPMQKKKRIIQKYVPPPIANIVVAAQSFFIRRLTNLFSDKLFSQDKVYLKIFILQQKTKYWLQNLHSCYLHSRVGW